MWQMINMCQTCDIMTVNCMFSKWPEATLLKDKEAGGVVKFLFKCFTIDGCCHVKISDQGREFEDQITWQCSKNFEWLSTLFILMGEWWAGPIHRSEQQHHQCLSSTKQWIGWMLLSDTAAAVIKVCRGWTGWMGFVYRRNSLFLSCFTARLNKAVTICSGFLGAGQGFPLSLTLDLVQMTTPPHGRPFMTPWLPLLPVRGPSHSHLVMT